MERIQAAIQKAKAKRSGDAPTLSRSRNKVLAVREAGEGQRPAEAAWAELEPFTPDSAVLQQHRIVTFDRGDPAHTSFDMMRTRALRTMRENNWIALGVTSPTAGCGKTTVSLNLAFSLAHQSDLRIVIMDLDLRRPSMARLIGLSRPQSVASMLQGTQEITESFVRCGENLALGTSARGSRRAAEVLHHSSTGKTLAALRTRLKPDVIIYDLPPMLASDDAMAFLPHLDCVLLVAAAEHSRLDEIDKCGHDLADQTNVLGLILNKCRYPGEEYAYY